MKVLAVDIGGSHVKALVSGNRHPIRFDSGKHLTPSLLLEGLRANSPAGGFDVVALGYPGPVGPDGPTAEAGNLGPGWVDFDFQQAFGRPVRIVNDAAMQALGAYAGGRTLFLGLGTGLGSALVSERVLVPLELGTLPYWRAVPNPAPEIGENIGDRLGKSGRDTFGQEAWMDALRGVIQIFHKAFLADSIVLGGGNARLVEPLPPLSRRCHNDDAFRGGFRLWEERVEPHDLPTSHVWRVAY